MSSLPYPWAGGESLRSGETISETQVRCTRGQPVSQVKGQAPDEQYTRRERGAYDD